MRWTRAVITLATLGATLGVALDGWHVATGTTRYASPSMFGIASWAIPLFAGAGVVVGVVPVVIERAVGRHVTAASRARVAIAIALFVAAYLVTGVLHGGVCAVVLAVIAIAIYAVGDRPPLALALAHALSAAAGGVLVETTLVHFGLFFHADDRLFGVAPWLPLLYVCASLALTTLARFIAAPLGASAG